MSDNGKGAESTNSNQMDRKESISSEASGASKSSLKGPRDPVFRSVADKPLPSHRLSTDASSSDGMPSDESSEPGNLEADVKFPQRNPSLAQGAITTFQQRQQKRATLTSSSATDDQINNRASFYGSSPLNPRPLSAVYQSSNANDSTAAARPMSAMYGSSPRNSVFMPSRSYTNSVGNQSILAQTVATDLDAMPEVNLPGFTPFPETEVKTDPVLSNVTADESQHLPPSNSSSTNLLRKFSQRFLPNRGKSQRQKQNYRRSHLPRQDLLNLGGISAVETSTTLQRQSKTDTKKNQSKKIPQGRLWYYFSHIVTCYAPNFILRQKWCCNRTTEPMQIAWREKMGLMTIIVFMWVLLGFLTFGFQNITCNSLSAQRFPLQSLSADNMAVRGVVFSVKGFTHPTGDPKTFFQQMQGKDATWLFPTYPQLLDGGVSACDSLFAGSTASVKIACTVDNVPSIVGFCHTLDQYVQLLTKLPRVGQISYNWENLSGGTSRMVAVNGYVINVDRYFSTGGTTGSGFLGADVDKILLENLGGDATRAFMRSARLQQSMNCLSERFRVGVIETTSAGCFASQAFMWASLATLLTVIILKFVLGLWFNWTLGNTLGKRPKGVPAINDETSVMVEEAKASASAMGAAEQPRKTLFPSKSRFSQQYNTQTKLANDLTKTYQLSRFNVKGGKTTPRDMIGILRSILLVTCYSEGEAGIRATLDSLARTDFPDSHKILFIIADGIIQGAGNSRSTPDLLKDMIVMDPSFDEPEAFSYVAIAEGQKRHNMAKVYAGHYHVEGHVVPTILVVKCGTPEEAEMQKPGNRGKRDSQILLMQFLTKVLFDDRMTSLEYDLFRKMTAVCSTESERVTPDLFELVLMVDADTKVMEDSLTHMSYAMYNDPRMIGLCGETRIANKSDSWVTAIQVFEYYISHFLTKSFESLFGSNTCLPGCFCMYRIKAPKGGRDASGHQYYTPILANPDIVEQYSENVVDTLHKKNLLLLGEDRYLTTLMLKTFPKRKLMFIPNAICKTVVPDRFKVLLSQRRRWINSTFHNLLELVWIRDLCGIFCFSMQFVIFMELVGTAVLPAAICFTIYLLIISFLVVPPPIIPLALLAAILGLPAFLILLSSRRWLYLGWMLIYLISLPIWNFVLPVYAYWHFDDFSWGQTRKIEGKDSGHDEDEGEFDHSRITMKRWYEWEKEERRKTAAPLSMASFLPSIGELSPRSRSPLAADAPPPEWERALTLSRLTNGR